MDESLARRGEDVESFATSSTLETSYYLHHGVTITGSEYQNCLSGQQMFEIISDGYSEWRMRKNLLDRTKARGFPDHVFDNWSVIQIALFLECGKSEMTFCGPWTLAQMHFFAKYGNETFSTPKDLRCPSCGVAVHHFLGWSMAEINNFVFRGWTAVDGICNEGKDFLRTCFPERFELLPQLYQLFGNDFLQKTFSEFKFLQLLTPEDAFPVLAEMAEVYLRQRIKEHVRQHSHYKPFLSTTAKMVQYYDLCPRDQYILCRWSPTEILRYACRNGETPKCASCGTHIACHEFLSLNNHKQVLLAFEVGTWQCADCSK